MAEQLKQGSTLLWYRIESMLGRGGFGITYLASDTNLQTRVAIKEYLPADIAERKEESYVMPRTGADGETYRWGLTRFIEEARILARFKHHNIVRVHSVFEENNTAYMVMDYEQGNGFDLLMRTPQFREEARLKSVFGDLLNGLELVHSHNVIHRDIKPSNIYIREDGSPVLLDFGSARQQIAGKSHNLTRVLTKGYAPYEQMDEDGSKQGPWTDIYALGATLYYVISSQLPADSFSRFTKLVQQQPDPLIPVHALPEAANYSAAFLAAIEQAMQFEARERPQTIAEFRQLLLGEAPQSTTPPAADDATVLADEATVLAVSPNAAPASPPQTAPPQAANAAPEPQPLMPGRPRKEAEAAPAKAAGQRPAWVYLLGAALFGLVPLAYWLLQSGAEPDVTAVAMPGPSEQAGLRAASEANKQAQAQAAEAQAQIAAEEEQARAEAARLAEEQARLEAEQRALAEEQARAEAAEQARLEAEKAALQAEQQRLSEARARAEEEQRQLAEEQAKAAEAARLAEEQARKLAEQKRLEQEQAKAAEAARLAEEKARQRAEQQRQEEARAQAAAAARKKAAQAARAAAVPAAERARQDNESDIQTVGRLFNDVKLTLTRCDTARLSSLTGAARDSRELVGQLCEQYQSMELAIADFQSNPSLGVASATVQIRRLVSQSGDTVLPGSSWSRLPMRTEKKDGYWQAVSW